MKNISVDCDMLADDTKLHTSGKDILQIRSNGDVGSGGASGDIGGGGSSCDVGSGTSSNLSFTCEFIGVK